MRLRSQQDRVKCGGILFVIALTMIFCLTGCGETEHKFFDFTCDYAIDVKLDPDSRSLAYTTQAHVKNNGQDGAEELYFHLYGNFYQT